MEVAHHLMVVQQRKVASLALPDTPYMEIVAVLVIFIKLEAAAEEAHHKQDFLGLEQIQQLGWAAMVGKEFLSASQVLVSFMGREAALQGNYLGVLEELTAEILWYTVELLMV